MIEKLLMKVTKNVDKTKHKMVIPKCFVDKYGYSFDMYVYEDKIIILPPETKLSKEEK